MHEVTLLGQNVSSYESNIYEGKEKIFNWKIFAISFQKYLT